MISKAAYQHAIVLQSLLTARADLLTPLERELATALHRVLLETGSSAGDCSTAGSAGNVLPVVAFSNSGDVRESHISPARGDFDA